MRNCSDARTQKLTSFKNPIQEYPQTINKRELTLVIIISVLCFKIVLEIAPMLFFDQCNKRKKNMTG